MTRRYFGTDGVRGVVGDELTADLVERLGAAYGRWSGGQSVLIGRDTRRSGPDLERALTAGLAASGSVAISGGILPTPAVALLADESGAVVSASHNPPEYNGVKFFRGGWKLEDEHEEEIEELLDAPDAAASQGAAEPPAPSAAAPFPDRYVDLVCERFGAPLDGLKVAVDCANGAMYEVGPRAFERLGAEVVTIGNTPDGTNINVGCGATDLRLLSETVAVGEFDLGVAFDGDGDRILAVDAQGAELDGDQILAVLALHLGIDLVAVTEMTNLGLHRLMAERGVRVLTTPVGDRYVLEALRREGGRLGGEQSGHIIWLDGHTSGDGLVGAILVCRAVRETGTPLRDLAAAMVKLPQAKANVPVRSKAIPDALRREIEALSGEGRVVVRPSGTEPVVRVLAEAETEEAAESLCGRIATLVSRELG
ncbi:MAG TPA: phosphoglucosamine mutase [Gaiellaceae bacterium]|nr:phosphoglucosamine mutase [Gaiellaceae bacterium]